MKKPSPQDNRVTMKDVAKVAGVSQSTVSFVLNGVREVSIADETKNRVYRAAQELGYKNRRRGSTVVQEHPVLGFMVDEISTSPFAAISIEGAQDAAWQSGYLLEVVMTGNDKEYEAAVLNKWLAYGVEGVIYSSILTRSASPPTELESMKSVLLNCYAEGSQYPGVVPSEVMGGFSATETLINRGYKNIACIAGEGWAEAAQDRLTGYRQALTTHGIPVRTELIRAGTFLPSSGYTETKAMLDLKIPLDAIFCANDLMAVGCYEALKEAGLRIPEDVAVMGYDDEEIAQHLHPTLSSVLLPHREMGQWAVEYLLTSHSDSSNRVYKLECPVMVRDSI